MPTFASLSRFFHRRLTLAAGIPLLALAAAGSVQAATMQAGNVTTALGPTFFVDDAANGGSDTDIHQDTTGPINFDRNFNGQLTPNQGPTRVSLTGFGFATHTSANDATAVAVTITYLGQDEAINGGDDVVVGTATGEFVFTPSASNPDAEYVLVFDTPLTADLNVTGTRFRIRLAPSNLGGNGSLKLKSGALAYETLSGAKLSVAGVSSPRINPQRVNLAKFQTVTATSVTGQYLASYLTDGVAGNDNRWQGSGSQWNAAQIDFPFPVEVGSAQVFTGVNDASVVNTFYLQHFDGSTWVTIPGGGFVSGNTNVERNIVFTNPITASSFRILGQDANLRVRELALYPPNGPAGFPLGTDLTLNLAYQRPTVASSSTAGSFALKAVDGRAHAGSTWQTATAGVNTLDIDLRVSTKIGSAHLYSGSPGVSPLGDFVLKSWNGTAWQDIAGATVTGNTAADRVVSFATPVVTSKVRLEFTNAGTSSIRELCIFPANTGNAGYPIGTNIIDSGKIAQYEDYHDAFHRITHPSSGRHMAVPAGGQTSLDQAGLTTEQGQYQVLLNLSNGTYRLRNRATGNCLSGWQLSKTPGLPLTDAPYLALPHQDWILDPLGGGTFQLVNQWSGLAIDTQGAATSPGTVLVQNTADLSATQRWQFSYSTWSPKKGIGGSAVAGPFAAKWFYNWGLENSQPVPNDAVFHPMQWGDFNWLIGSNNGPNWQYYPAWRRSADAIHHLGFNEPDGADQANIPVNSAIALWPRLQEMDQPLLSPAPAGLNNGWLNSFFTQAGNLGYRVDYTGVHAYPGPGGGGSSNGLIGTLQTAYDNWQRPVWLTEFSFVDWNGNASWSEEDNYQTLAEFLWRAESLPWLRNYALFVFTEDASYPQPANPWQNFTPAPRSNSYDLAGNLTAFGKLYAAWDNDTTVRTGKPYYIHHKTSHKRLANLLASGPNGRSIRVDGPPVNWTLSPTGTSGRYHIVSSVDGRRLSSANGAAPTFAAAGTVGPNVEWTLTGSQHGWFYIGHPASSRRLQLVYDNNDSTAAYSMVSNANEGPELEWRFIVPPPSPVWSGLDGNSWTNPRTWVPGIQPAAGDLVTFNEVSVANLGTLLDQNFSIGGLIIANPAGPVSIGGTHQLTVGAGGIDLSAATRDLTLTAPTILGAAQTWNVAAGRTLAVNGGITGGFPLTIAGAGTTTLGGAVDPLATVTVAAGSTLKTNALSVLPNGLAASNPSLQGVLDLNGTSQSVNLLTGSGAVDNTSPNPATLTIGNNNAGGTLNNLLQDTHGPLTLIKTGSASLTLPIANTHGGGFTNNGAGNIIPQNNDAFGSGSVVMNGATIYATAANFTFTNSLALNGAILRVGGSNSRTLTWNGPVTATGNSGISADGGTTGVTLGGSLDITGATFTSTNTSLNAINGPITGAGGNLVALGTNGVLQLAGNNTYGGTTTVGDGSFLRLTATGILPPSSNITNNGGLTIRNTVSWVHNGPITGDGSASISLNTGTNATLAGSISGISSINVDNAGTDATISGAIGGPANITIQGTVDANGVGAILRLGGANTYTGTTTITRGRLVLAASDVLPDSSAVTIGNATLDAGTFTDTAGTLDVTSTLSTLQLGTGAVLAFANSNGVSWTGGNLRINGAFVPGVSVRFGTTAGGLTPTQLGLIRVNGSSGPFTLSSAGFLMTAVTDPYDLWKSQITNGQDGRSQDADGDGFTNQHEFLFGTSPVAGAGALLASSVNGANFVLRWMQRGSGATYSVEQSATLAAASWIAVAAPIPAPDPDQAGVPGGYVRQLVTLPMTGGARFYRISATEN